MLIERVQYVGGDDGVAVKSGWDDAGIAYNTPSVNITVRDSSFTTQACCVCIGSEMSGGARNVSVSNVTCVNVGNAFQVKTTPGRGGYVHGFSVTDSSILGASTALMVMMTYGDHPQPPLTWNASALPVLSGFYFACVGCRGVGAGFHPSPFSCAFSTHACARTPAHSHSPTPRHTLTHTCTCARWQTPHWCGH